MSKEFKEGQKLRSVFGPTDNDGCYIQYTVGRSDCTDIEVVMENGQTAGVPWAYITVKDAHPKKVNLALVEEVHLM